MALATAAIQTSIRNVLDGTFTGIRDITVGTFKVGSPSEEAAKALALTAPAYEIEIGGQQEHPATPLSNSASIAIEMLPITIAITYALPTVAEVSARYAIQATIANNANLLVQALTFPGNLADDGAGTPVATGIVSGMLMGEGGVNRPSVTHERDWSKQTATTTINASAVVVVTQPTS
jgi:hypothetical protein